MTPTQYAALIVQLCALGQIATACDQLDDEELLNLSYQLAEAREAVERARQARQARRE